MKKLFILVLIALFAINTQAGTYRVEKECARETNVKQNSTPAQETIVNNDSCDIITLRNGDEINAKVIEIDQDVVKYKKCENLSGPVYTLSKSEILFIKYSDGQKDVFTQNNAPKKEKKQDNSQKLSVRYSFWGPRFFRGDRRISRRVFMNLLEDNPNSALQAQSAATMNVLSIIFYVIGLLIILGLSILLGLLVYGIGAIFGLIGNSQLSKAVDKYNNSKK